MRRMVDYRVLMFATAALCCVGCSNSPSPDVADGSDAIETRPDVTLPDSPKAVNLMPGEDFANNSSPATSESQPAPVEIADGADSDEPGSYESSAAGEASNSPREAAPALNQEVAGEEAAKQQGRADSDDPAAPLIIPKVAEQQDESPLNNGREPTAQPIPEEQRIAVTRQEDPAEPLEAGRAPNAKPGDAVASPVKVTPTAKPTIKPAAPSRKTLSDLPESIQALDKDGDGQLGLYEWPREKLAEFKTLDKDQDGFLTPAELVAGQKKPSEAESPHSDEQPTANSDEKADEKAATKTDDGSQQDDAEATEADTANKSDTADKSDTTDKQETSDTPAEGTDSQDGSSGDDQPAQGS